MTILVARDGGSSVSVCGYLVDVWCLGVKNALGPKSVERRKLPEFTDSYFRSYDQPPLAAPIDLARHVVFGAVAYARGLGFEPHPDFAPCASHLGPWEGRSDITFGLDGKPMYIQGPHDNAAQVMRTLRRSVGDGNYDYLSQLPGVQVRREATAGRGEELLAFLIERSSELKLDLRGAPGCQKPGAARHSLQTPNGIFDFTDGLNFYPEYGMLRDLFGDPALAADKRYTDVLRGYLQSETITPLPLQRLAAAHPGTVDAVFRKVLRRRDFTWAEHGEELMRHRKAWYYQREPRPGVTVIGDRLVELASGARR